MFGAAGYVSAGWGAAGLPPWSLGFVYLPAFVLMSAGGAIGGVLGVRLAGRLDEGWLRRLLAIFLLVSAGVIAAGG